MKTITRSTSGFAAAAMVLMLVIPAAAQTHVPKGTVQALNGTFQGSDDVSYPNLTQSIAGTGTHFGQFSSTANLTLTASGGTGTGEWNADQDDAIHTNVVGFVEPVETAPCQVVGAQPDDTYAKITQIHIIRDGTGRFAGVQGSFLVTLFHDVVHRSDGTNGTCGFYSGIILPPDTAH